VPGEINGRQRKDQVCWDLRAVAKVAQEWIVENGLSEPGVQSVTEFCRFARENGLSGGLHQTLAALECVRSVGIEDQEVLAFALRAALCSSKTEWDRFDELLSAFQNQSQRSHQSSTAGPRRAKQGANERQTSSPHMLSQIVPEPPAGSDNEGKAVTGASAHERLKQVDFSEVGENDMAPLEELSARLLRQMSLRLSRRLRAGKGPGPVDLRRTIRRNLARGGDLIQLAFRNQKPQKTKLVIVLDISGSMNAYSVFLLKFVYALQKHFRQVETFLFSTSIVEITGTLRTRRLPEALARLSEFVAGWSGGTKIGDALRQLNRHAGRKARSRHTIFVILSDGWDTGAPEVLATELRAVRRRVRKIIWLNPLLGLYDYRPVTRGMSAALPYIDVFAPAHNLESLLDLEKHL
jgi:uncharacterized protein